MKNILLFAFCFLTVLGTFAQEEELSKEEKERREKNIQAVNPFAKFGYKAKVATLSKGKYLEVHDLDSIVTIGTVRWNTNQNKIVGEIERDTTDMYAQPIGDAVGRWLSPDPLSEEFSEWSPYTAMNDNPINYVDPTGMAAEDIITINNDGSIDRIETDDNFDIVQNEDGSKSITVAHNENGSQIGEVQTATGTDQNGNTVSTEYMLIENKDVATKVFEFGAEVSKDAYNTTGKGFEFSMDSFSFSDGFNMNSISVGNNPTGGAFGAVTPLGVFSGIDLGGNHFTENSTWTENNHFHPNGNYQPSGFRAYLVNGSPSFFVANDRPGGDRGFTTNSRAQNHYLYSYNLGGYVQYNNNSASFIGKKK